MRAVAARAGGQLIPLHERPPARVVSDYLGRQINLDDEVVLIGPHRAFLKGRVGAIGPGNIVHVDLAWREKLVIREASELIVVF